MLQLEPQSNIRLAVIEEDAHLIVELGPSLFF